MQLKFTNYQLSKKWNNLKTIHHDYHGWCVREGKNGIAAVYETQAECDSFIEQYNKAIGAAIRT